MQLKSIPEDFLVREFLIPPLSEGNFALYLLRKKQWNTDDVLHDIARTQGLLRKAIATCGNKDRQAVTEQYITIKHGPHKSLSGKDYTCTYLGQVGEALHLGAHLRNYFTITLRDVPEHTQVASVRPKNYFGEQRFGTNNDEIGLHLLRKDYAAAAKGLNLTFTTDPITALRTVPKQILTLYLHAAQSRLWNERVQQLPESITSYQIPGYGEPVDDDMLALLAKHNLTEDCFVNRSMHELSLEGGAREVYQDVRDFSASTVRGGICIVHFSLPPGQYATETIRQLLQE